MRRSRFCLVPISFLHTYPPPPPTRVRMRTHPHLACVRKPSGVCALSLASCLARAHAHLQSLVSLPPPLSLLLIFKIILSTSLACCLARALSAPPALVPSLHPHRTPHASSPPSLQRAQAYENSHDQDYVTEKLFDCLRAGSIPVVG